MPVKNVYSLPGRGGGGEVIECLASGPSARIERIVSRAEASPPGIWYDQETDEWVALLTGEAELTFAGGRRVHLGPGDHLVIPAHARHRVEWTSADPPCVWLAVHGDLKTPGAGPGPAATD